jgi:hypothetical protein
MKKLKKGELHRHNNILQVMDNLDLPGAQNVFGKEHSLFDGPKEINSLESHKELINLIDGSRSKEISLPAKSHNNDLSLPDSYWGKELSLFDDVRPGKEIKLSGGSQVLDEKSDLYNRFNMPYNDCMDVSCEDDLLEGFIDIHIHTAPDIKPRLLNDVEAAISASTEGMQAIVIKSHFEPTSGRAKIAEEVTGFKVFGGVCLNWSVGGLNLEAVKTAASMGGKFVWFPTVSYSSIKLDSGGNVEILEEIMNLAAEHRMVLATGHLKADDILFVMDTARSIGVDRLLVNHPLTGLVGASVDEQKEMSRYAYLEHCFVACMPGHDELDPTVIADAIKEVGPSRCIMATDFGQAHNPTPVQGMRMFVNSMLDHGISMKDVRTMCIENPSKLLFKP